MSRIIVLCCFRDAAAYLADFIDHLNPLVDGFILLDDRSRDGEEAWGELADSEGASKIIGIVARGGHGGEPFAYETRNRAILLREALAEGATSVVCLDVDERVGMPTQRQFIQADRAQQPIIAWARNLWNDEKHFRVDGVWGRKRKCVLFTKQDLIDFDSSPPQGVGNQLHQPWMPWNGSLPTFGEVFHMGGMTPEQRAERVLRHQAADLERKWQADYSYLANEEGLRLEVIPKGRNWY